MWKPGISGRDPRTTARAKRCEAGGARYGRADRLLAVDLKLHDPAQLRETGEILGAMQRGGHRGEISRSRPVRLDALTEVLLAGRATQRDEPARNPGGSVSSPRPGSSRPCGSA